MFCDTCMLCLVRLVGQLYKIGATRRTGNAGRLVSKDEQQNNIARQTCDRLVIRSNGDIFARKKCWLIGFLRLCGQLFHANIEFQTIGKVVRSPTIFQAFLHGHGFMKTPKCWECSESESLSLITTSMLCWV